MDKAADSGYTSELLDCLTEIRLALIHRYLDPGRMAIILAIIYEEKLK